LIKEKLDHNKIEIKEERRKGGKMIYFKKDKVVK
jgi:hypothetical protein